MNHDLTIPDERNVRLGIQIDYLASQYTVAEEALSTNVPEEIRQRIATAQFLGTYAWFCYEFHAVCGPGAPDFLQPVKWLFEDFTVEKERARKSDFEWKLLFGSRLGG